MAQKLMIKAFFFNAKTDYLPYYKHFTLTLPKEATAKDLLVMIQEQNENFSFPKQKLIMKINGLVVEAKESIANIVERFGDTLQIDPVNAYRSMNGLKINDEDFMQSFALLEPYATQSDVKFYKTLYALHYASETEKFDHAYIGDAILVLAHKMISEGSEHKEAILEAITSVDSGLLDCEYENNLFNGQSHAAAITALKGMAKNNENEHPSLLDMIKARFCPPKETKETTPENTKRITKYLEGISEKTVAYYAGLTGAQEEEVTKVITDSGMNSVSFARKNRLSGLSLLEDNKTLALKKAGATLLDAYDAGCELLIIEDESTYDMFISQFKAIECVVGRKMGGLELLTAADFIKQMTTHAA